MNGDLDHTYQTQRSHALSRVFNSRSTQARTNIHTTSVSYIHTYYRDAVLVKTAD